MLLNKINMVYYFYSSLVTPYSKIEFKVFDYKQLRANILLGQTTVDLYKLLKEHNGTCKCSFTCAIFFLAIKGRWNMVDFHNNAVQQQVHKIYI